MPAENTTFLCRTCGSPLMELPRAAQGTMICPRCGTSFGMEVLMAALQDHLDRYFGLAGADNRPPVTVRIADDERDRPARPVSRRRDKTDPHR